MTLLSLILAAELLPQQQRARPLSTAAAQTHVLVKILHGQAISFEDWDKVKHQRTREIRFVDTNGLERRLRLIEFE